MRTLFLLALAALTAAGCSGPRDVRTSALPCLTCTGRVLDYTVEAGNATYPFEVTVEQNDDDGLAFGYDLGDGGQVGTVRMSPEARTGAMGFMNQFGSDTYDLTDRTSVWLSRDAFLRLKAGQPVTIDFGGQDGSAVLTSGGCSADGFAVMADAMTHSYSTCTFTGEGGQRLTVLDDDDDPLILQMNTGSFEVALESAE